nr:hypothetical protein [Pandoravirus massiliensis]
MFLFFALFPLPAPLIFGAARPLVVFPYPAPPSFSYPGVQKMPPSAVRQIQRHTHTQKGTQKPIARGQQESRRQRLFFPACASNTLQKDTRTHAHTHARTKTTNRHSRQVGGGVCTWLLPPPVPACFFFFDLLSPCACFGVALSSSSSKKTDHSRHSR